MSRDNTTRERIRALEVSVDEIKTNHLPHMDAKMDKIQVRLDNGLWFLVTTLVGVISTLVLLYFK